MRITTRATALSAVALCSLALAGLSVPAHAAEIATPAQVKTADPVSALTQAEKDLVASGIQGATLNSDGTLNITVSTALLQSQITVAVVGNGKYLGGTWGGSATYASWVTQTDTAVTLHLTGNTIAAGDTVVVYYGKNGFPVTNHQTDGWKDFAQAVSFTPGGVDKMVRNKGSYTAHVSGAAHKNMPVIGFEINGTYAGDKTGDVYHYFGSAQAADGGFDIGGYLPREGNTFTAYVPYTVPGSSVQGKVVLASVEGGPYVVTAPSTITRVGTGLSIGNSGANCLGDGKTGLNYSYDCLRFKLSNPLPLVAKDTFFDVTFSQGAVNPIGFQLDGYWRIQDLGTWQIEGCSDASCSATTVVSSAQPLAAGASLKLDANTSGTAYQTYRFRYLGGGVITGTTPGTQLGTGGFSELSLIVN